MWDRIGRVRVIDSPRREVLALAGAEFPTIIALLDSSFISLRQADSSVNFGRGTLKDPKSPRRALQKV